MQLGSKETENERFAHYFMKTFRKTASLIANALKAVRIVFNCLMEFVFHFNQSNRDVQIYKNYYNVTIISQQINNNSPILDRSTLWCGRAHDRGGLPIRPEYWFGLPVRGRSVGLCVINGGVGKTCSRRSEAGAGHSTCPLCLREGTNLVSYALNLN